MTDLLDRTLREWRQGAHVWGQSDCLLSVGDYMHAAGWLDIPSRFRGTYDTEQGAIDHINANGGCEGLIDLTGAPRTDDPQRGDVALVQGIGALCTGDAFVLRLERGTVEVLRRLVSFDAAWKV